MDKFDTAHERIWGKPGFQVRRSTISSAAFLGIPQGDWILETVKTDEEWAVFIRYIAEGESLRLVLPGKVIEALFRHKESITAKARKERAKRGAETLLKRHGKYNLPKKSPEG